MECPVRASLSCPSARPAAIVRQPQRTRDWQVAAFHDAVDAFMAAPKTVTGIPKWSDARNPPDQEAFWLLSVCGNTSQHRLAVRASPQTAWRGFAVLVIFSWQGSDYAVTRLMADTDAHSHINRHGRPEGAPFEVFGHRIYTWADNRSAFRLGDRQLPFARPVGRPQADLHNAIRHVAGLAKISLADVALLNYPERIGLL